MIEEDQLKLNEWIPQEGFRYEVYWPYQDTMNPDTDPITVEVKLDKDPKIYGLTFITLNFLQSELLWNKKNEANLNRAYYLFDTDDILVGTTDKKNIESIIGDLIKQEDLIKRAFVVKE